MQSPTDPPKPVAESHVAGHRRDATSDDGAGAVVLLALGSNLGDRKALLGQALARLSERGVRLVRASSLHETPALMPEGAPADWDRPYLNQVVEVRTTLTPDALLDCTQAVERDLGRAPAPRWAPRRLDIDLMAYGDLILQTPRLTLPHPQMDRRRFVLAPLCEIAPQWRHPLRGVTAAELLEGLSAD